MFSVVVLRWKNKRPVNVVDRFFKTKSFSLQLISPPSKWSLIVALCESYCRLASIVWKSGGGPPLKFVHGAKVQILHESASGVAADMAPESIRLSLFSSPKSEVRCKNMALCVCFSVVVLLIEGECLWVQPAFNRTVEKMVFTIVICLWLFCCLSEKKLNGDVPGKVGNTVHTSNKAYWCALHTCESVLRSLPSRWLLGLLWSYVNTN